MAKAAKLTIVEAENIVEVGEIDANDVNLPGIFVDRIVPSTAEKQIEVLKLRDDSDKGSASSKPVSEAQQKRVRIAKRAAKELKEGFYVNLGVGKFPIHSHPVQHLTLSGIPTLAASLLPSDRKVWIQSENGILGMGPYPTKDEVDP